MFTIDRTAKQKQSYNQTKISLSYVETHTRAVAASELGNVNVNRSIGKFLLDVLSFLLVCVFVMVRRRPLIERLWKQQNIYIKKVEMKSHTRIENVTLATIC